MFKQELTQMDDGGIWKKFIDKQILEKKMELMPKNNIEYDVSKDKSNLSIYGQPDKYLSTDVEFGFVYNQDYYGDKCYNCYYNRLRKKAGHCSKFPLCSK